MTGSKILVVGAKPDSLGEAVQHAVFDPERVVTAGLHDESYEPDFRLDIVDDAFITMRHLIVEQGIRHVVCTAGINMSGAVDKPHSNIADLEEHLAVNTVGVVRLMETWRLAVQSSVDDPPHFVVISSNSAHVPRRNSLAYCTSKAALSMAVRCYARDYGGSAKGRAIYCYEPGLLSTPQTRAVANRMMAEQGSPVPMHRIPNNNSTYGFSPEDLAGVIVSNIWRGTASMLNGCCIRLDGGEI